MVATVKTYAIETRRLAEQPTAAMFATLTVDQIGGWIGQAYGRIAASLGRRGAGPTGMPYARYHRTGQSTFEVEAGFPASRVVETDGDVRPSSLPGGPAVATWHIGPYDQMEPAYHALLTWVTDHGGTVVGDPWELYYSDPVSEPDPATWRTEIIQPYR